MIQIDSGKRLTFRELWIAMHNDPIGMFTAKNMMAFVEYQQRCIIHIEECMIQHIQKYLSCRYDHLNILLHYFILMKKKIKLEQAAYDMHNNKLQEGSIQSSPSTSGRFKSSVQRWYPFYPHQIFTRQLYHRKPLLSARLSPSETRGSPIAKNPTVVQIELKKTKKTTGYNTANIWSAYRIHFF